MYSRDKINIALEIYNQCRPVTETVHVLGHLTRRALYTWISNEWGPKKSWSTSILRNIPEILLLK